MEEITKEDIEVIKTFETFLFELKKKFNIQNFKEFREEMFHYVFYLNETKDKDGIYEIVSKYAGVQDAES